MEPPLSPKIRHLVLSGGATILFQFYSVLKHSLLSGFWNYAEIESTYSTSAGTISLVAVCLAHHLGWDLCDNFLINRPWHNVYDFSVERILGAYGNVGIFNQQLMADMFSPLLSALDLPLTITLQEFHQFSGIEMHFMTTRLSTYELVDLSYKTHPEWKLLDAMYASCALPVLLKPIEINGELYADGALLCNYPVKPCLDSGAVPAEIFGLYKHADYSISSPDYNMFSYIVDIVAKSIGHSQSTTKIPFEIVCSGEVSMSLTRIYEMCKSAEMRSRELKRGEEVWTEYYDSLSSASSTSF